MYLHLHYLANLEHFKDNVCSVGKIDSSYCIQMVVSTIALAESWNEANKYTVQLQIDV